eukprot:TRINITY_DN1307_c0_g1_i5.p1 TRINITY_DN1307_c0_g1~~TRINITY_DN1307_c0_g1_i5.p1  ORF type:complete len:234 (+),score=25.74 TRINITY_DN1307_c0_g1_i5:610-1311(+)
MAAFSPLPLIHSDWHRIETQLHHLRQKQDELKQQLQKLNQTLEQLGQPLLSSVHLIDETLRHILNDENVATSPSGKRSRTSDLRFGFSTTLNDCVSTPPDLLDRLRSKYRVKRFYDLCPRYAKFNGLTRKYDKYTFVNPPFSDTATWVKYSLKQSQQGCIVILLIPIRSASTYWNQYIFPHATDFSFLPPITFVGYSKPLPIPLCLVEFDSTKQPIFSKTQDSSFGMWSFSTK